MRVWWSGIHGGGKCVGQEHDVTNRYAIADEVGRIGYRSDL